MVEGADIYPDVHIPRVEVCHGRTAIGAEASLGEVAGCIGLELALRQTEGRSWEPRGRAEKAAVVLPAHRAMADVSPERRLLRLIAHGAAEAAARDRNSLNGHRYPLPFNTSRRKSVPRGIPRRRQRP